MSYVDMFAGRAASMRDLRLFAETLAASENILTGRLIGESQWFVKTKHPSCNIAVKGGLCCAGLKRVDEVDSAR